MKTKKSFAILVTLITIFCFNPLAEAAKGGNGGGGGSTSTNPVIHNAFVDVGLAISSVNEPVDGNEVIVIQGLDLRAPGEVPSVHLGDSAPLPLASSDMDTPEEVILELPIGTLDGTYVLSLSSAAGFTSLDFTVGTVGPQGPKGDKGDKGDTGSAGASGVLLGKGISSINGAGQDGTIYRVSVRGPNNNETSHTVTAFCVDSTDIAISGRCVAPHSGLTGEVFPGWVLNSAGIDGNHTESMPASNMCEWTKPSTSGYNAWAYIDCIKIPNEGCLSTNGGECL